MEIGKISTDNYRDDCSTGKYILTVDNFNQFSDDSMKTATVIVITP